jgi:hypothetical protein
VAAARVGDQKFVWMWGDAGAGCVVLLGASGEPRVVDGPSPILV